jgi:hypothetical protein
MVLGEPMSEAGQLNSAEPPVIRPYRPGDEKAINLTFNEVFRRDRPLDEWSWKFFPVPDGRAIMLAVQGEQVLAQYAGLPTRFHLDGQVWPALEIVDIYSTRAALRQLARRGLWVQTVDAFYATFGASGRYPLLFGFPGLRSLRIGLLQLGYDHMPPQPLTYLCRSHGSYRRRPRQLIYRAEVARDWEPKLDQLWSQVRQSYPVAVVRDADRALRRLAGHPTIRYHRFMVFPRFSTTPVAFAAFRTDGHRCCWVDLLWDHGHPGALELLARLGARLAAEARADCEEIWLNGDPEGESRLEDMGFERRPEPNGLVMVARSFTPELDVLDIDQRVYVTMADADLV